MYGTMESIKQHCSRNHQIHLISLDTINTLIIENVDNIKAKVTKSTISEEEVYKVFLHKHDSKQEVFFWSTSTQLENRVRNFYLPLGTTPKTI